MQRWLLVCTALYAPHLLEEHFTAMWNDRVIVAAFDPLSHLPAREAAYTLFQIMLAVALAMTSAFSLGGRWRAAVMAALGVALLCEAHHVVRAAAALSYNSGLVTSLPMPIVGALVLRAIVMERRTS